MSDGYHGMIIRGPLERLEAIPLVCSLNNERIEATRQRFARRDSA